MLLKWWKHMRRCRRWGDRMSADSKSICPICHVGVDDEIDENYTVREYYEFLLNDDATLSIEYIAKCDDCGAEWEYTNNHTLCRKVIK